MDDKKTYYISVGAGQILEDKEAASFELEVRATEREISELQELFEDTASEDKMQFIDVHFGRGEGGFDMNHPQEGYMDSLRQIYSFLHRIGTEETRRHIESMNILEPDHEEAPFGEASQRRL